jgi:CBS domain-containing protein
MKIKELMTREVRAVGPETPLKEVAAVLAEEGISGLPVCDADGRVLGVVSEADILARERGAVRERFDLLAWLSEWQGPGAERKLSARTAAEAMTAPAITIREGDAVTKAAALLVDRGINRLPVVDAHGRLTGIVTRADLVRAFGRGDDEIEAEIRAEVLGRLLSIPAGSVDVEVRDGDVRLAGEVETRELEALVRGLTARVLGVVSVRSGIRWQRVSTESPPGRTPTARVR